MPLDMNRLMMDPMFQFGMGMLGGSGPGTSLADTAKGGLLGLNNLQDMRYRQAQMSEYERKREEADRARQWVGDNMPNLAGAPEWMQRAVLEAQMKAQYRTPEYGTTAHVIRNRKTKELRPAQQATTGGMFVQSGEGMAPVDWNEWEYVQKVSPLDLGGGYGFYNPYANRFENPGAPSQMPNIQSPAAGAPMPSPNAPPVRTAPMPGVKGPSVVPKSLPPEQLPSTKGAQARASAQGQQEGARSGQAVANLQEMRARLPQLQRVITDLDKLAEQATYTMAGKARDAIVKESGMGATRGAVARKSYEAKVNNQILPLLRLTFGAQFTEREGQTLRETLGDPDASPEEKQAVLRAFIDQKISDIESLEREVMGGPVEVQSDGMPKPGDVVDGYRYKGGDPANPNSWEKAQ